MMNDKENSSLRLPRVHWAAHIQSPAEGELFEETTREINLLLVQSGAIESEIGGVVLSASAGVVLVYPARMRVRETIRGGSKYLRIFFVTGSASFDDTPRAIPLPHDDRAARWMNDVCDLHAMSDMNRALTGPLLEAITVRLRQIEQRRAHEKTLHPGVAVVMKQLEENLSAAFTLPELARHAHLSAGHLRELFRQQVGSSPLKYQHDLRMQRALRLLEEPHLSLAQIARACGFSDPEYFARRFRRYHQMSPGQLRRKMVETPAKR